MHSNCMCEFFGANLTNTHCCFYSGTIPDESKAVQLAAPASAVAGGFTGSSGGLLPTPPIPAQVDATHPTMAA